MKTRTKYEIENDKLSTKKDRDRDIERQTERWQYNLKQVLPDKWWLMRA